MSRAACILLIVACGALAILAASWAAFRQRVEVVEVCERRGGVPAVSPRSGYLCLREEALL